MADLEVGDSELSSKNLQRIKADIKQFIRQQNDVQARVDRLNAEIESEGPNADLEGRLEHHLKEQQSVCKRSNFAVSVIGLAIEDLTEFSQNPPSMLAITDLLDSTEDFTDDASRETLRRALGVIQDGDLATCTDVLEDLERAYKSLSEEHLPRTTKILQTTQLAVRDLATDPIRRRISRRSRLTAKNLAAYQRRQQSPSASSSSDNLSTKQEDRQKASKPQTSYLCTQNNQNTQNPQKADRISDAQSFHKYIDFLLAQFPVDDLVKAIKTFVDHDATSKETGLDDMMAQMNRDVAGVDVVKVYEEASVPLVSTDDRDLEGGNSDLEREMKKLNARVQALEDHVQVKPTKGASDRVKEEDGSLEKKESHHSNKRPSSAAEAGRRMKRSRS
jgi:hypothetical protein